MKGKKIRIRSKKHNGQKAQLTFELINATLNAFDLSNVSRNNKINIEYQIKKIAIHEVRYLPVHIFASRYTLILSKITQKVKPVIIDYGGHQNLNNILVVNVGIRNSYIPKPPIRTKPKPTPPNPETPRAISIRNKRSN